MISYIQLTLFRRDDLPYRVRLPRFGRTATAVPSPPADPGQHTDDVLRSFGWNADDIAKLRASGAVA